MAPRNVTDVSPLQRPLRIIASGTFFLTHTLSLPTYPEPSAVVRASSVARTRGGSASTCLAILAQFPSVDAMLIAPLGGNEDGQRIIHDLERERVSTRFCKVWEEAGVPSAWVLHAGDADTRTVINNNPLPDITHDDFISLLGPLLAPENYAHMPSPPLHTAMPGPGGAVSATINNLSALQSRPSTSSVCPLASSPYRPIANTNSPAPFDWIHFEGRSVKTTLSNMMGLDGLARERKWRSHCVFSVDVGRRTRQGVEALVPYADVVFLNKHYARAHSPQFAASPRAFLLSLTTLAAPHALLLAYWGQEGAAVLSVPTREYFQSSGWADPDASSIAPQTSAVNMGMATTAGHSRQESESDGGHEIRSVRTESDFWAGQHTESSSMFTAAMLSPSTMSTPSSPQSQARIRMATTAGKRPARESSGDEDGDSTDSDGTQIAPRHVDHSGDYAGQAPLHPAAAGGTLRLNAGRVNDEVGAQDAFVAGMMYALSRRMLPGEPYTPSSGGHEESPGREDRDKGKWRLEECLRFATELAGRKARKKGWDGLAQEMAQAGWFNE